MPHPTFLVGTDPTPAAPSTLDKLKASLSESMGGVTSVRLKTWAELTDDEKKKVYTWGAVAALSGAASGYHGYKRNAGSVGWAAGWALLGAMFPVITPAVAVVQGFGKK
jgi:hypothetical protein